MRFATILALAFSIASAAVAADNPAGGSWILNAAQSRLNGVQLPMVQGNILRIAPDVYTGLKTPDRRASSSSSRNQPGPSVFRFSLSADKNTLTMTNPAYGNFEAVFDRR